MEGLEPIDAREWHEVECDAVAAVFDVRYEAFEAVHGDLLPLVRRWLASRIVFLMDREHESPVEALDRAFAELALLVYGGEG